MVGRRHEGICSPMKDGKLRGGLKRLCQASVLMNLKTGIANRHDLIDLGESMKLNCSGIRIRQPFYQVGA
ncbi:crossover junction endonuclease mus81 [Histoplasma capsulatum G186AR]|uniref:Crossover junction endonuclease mus81 n=1 Tax=Ajellomyces capsulatus TaxID=5037 RepID=A0A8H7YZK8_AJECA|nr:crossover junction endonuclease mus81 [Histoplasma capsulatum]QSS68359.1 crossover junction endonuclease mus81 [Histoplasma capsulatum G186AR]